MIPLFIPLFRIHFPRSWKLKHWLNVFIIISFHFEQSFWIGWIVGSWPLFWALFISFLLGTAYSIDVSWFCSHLNDLNSSDSCMVQLCYSDMMCVYNLSHNQNFLLMHSLVAINIRNKLFLQNLEWKRAKESSIYVIAKEFNIFVIFPIICTRRVEYIHLCYL